jgi:hypothetical protein
MFFSKSPGGLLRIFISIEWYVSTLERVVLIIRILNYLPVHIMDKPPQQQSISISIRAGIFTIPLNIMEKMGILVYEEQKKIKCWFYHTFNV